MNRRIFLYRTSMGALGYSFFSGFPFHNFTQPSFSASLESFFLSIGAQPQIGIDSDSTLESVYKKESRAWEQTGYKAISNQYFLWPQSQKAICLLHLPHEEMGSLDVSALVFQKAALLEGWEKITALSGFQLEALVRAAKDLKAANGPNRLADLLLPVLRPAKRTPGRFLTELGEVSVKADLGKDKIIQVEAAVYESGQTLWSSKYTSQYLQSL